MFCRSTNLFNLLVSLKSGTCNGVRVALGRFQQMVNTACVDTLHFVNGHPDALGLNSSSEVLHGAGYTTRTRMARAWGGTRERPVNGPSVWGARDIP